MKPYLLFPLLFISLHSPAQKDTGSIRLEQYCSVRTYSLFTGNTVEVSVDYGQKKERGLFNMNIMKDENGKRVIFNSEIDALNYFGTQGWKLVNAFPVREGRDSYTRYLFKRTTPL